MESKELEKLSIFELRDLARKVGVFNPTVLKKLDLIQAICDVQTGVKKPHFSKTKQGRPPKEIGGYDKLIQIFLPNDIDTIPTKEETLYAENNNKIEFCSDPELADKSAEKLLYKGYLEILNNACGLIRGKILSSEASQQELVFVPSRDVEKFNLKGGDEIICLASVVSKDRPMVLVQIKEINGVEAKKFDRERKNYDDLSFRLSPEYIDIKDEEIRPLRSKLKIKYGDTIFCHYTENLEFKNFCHKFILSERENFDDIIYVAPTMRSKDYSLLQNLPADIFYTDFTDAFHLQKRVAFLAVNRAKRLAEMGKNVCLFIDDIISLVSLDKDSCENLSISKSIISCAKCLERGSITIICGEPKISEPILHNIIMTTFSVVEDMGLYFDEGKINFDISYRK